MVISGFMNEPLATMQMKHTSLDILLDHVRIPTIFHIENDILVNASIIERPSTFGELLECHGSFLETIETFDNTAKNIS